MDNSSREPIDSSRISDQPALRSASGTIWVVAGGLFLVVIAAVLAAIISSGGPAVGYAITTIAVVAALYLYPGEGLAAQLMTWATFAITFVVRPLGAVIIGRYADKHGRKSALSLTIGLMTLGVFIIVVLPGESVLGIWAAIILIIARVIQGISAGGEFGSATAFLTENAKRGKAFYASFQTATQGISMFLAAGVSWIFSSALSEEALHSWGWRV